AAGQPVALDGVVARAADERPARPGADHLVAAAAGRPEQPEALDPGVGDRRPAGPGDRRRADHVGLPGRRRRVVDRQVVHAGPADPTAPASPPPPVSTRVVLPASVLSTANASGPVSEPRIRMPTPPAGSNAPPAAA